MRDVSIFRGQKKKHLRVCTLITWAAEEATACSTLDWISVYCSLNFFSISQSETIRQGTLRKKKEKDKRQPLTYHS